MWQKGEETGSRAPSREDVAVQDAWSDGCEREGGVLVRLGCYNKVP